MLQSSTLSPRPATLTVAKRPGLGDATSLQSAIDKLPPDGGVVIVGEGRFSVPATIDIPAKPIAIIGSGPSTILDLGTNTVPMFKIVDGSKRYVFEGFSAEAADLAGQTLFAFDTPLVIGTLRSEFCVRNVWAETTGAQFDKIFEKLGGSDQIPKVISDCRLRARATGIAIDALSGFEFVGGVLEGSIPSGGGIPLKGTGVTLVLSGTASITGDFVNSTFAMESSATMTFLAGTMTGCLFVAASGTTITSLVHLIAGSGSRKFIGCTFQALAATVERGLLSSGTGTRLEVIGCDFAGPFTMEGVKTAGTGEIYVGNRGFKVTEFSTADANRYDSNEGFAASTIIGPDSLVDGVRRKSVSGGATVDALVEVFTHTNQKGVIGVGTIKNTHGTNSLTVRETAEDFFGTTATLDTPVAGGGTSFFILDPTVTIGTARPPYKSYKVEVRSTVPATPATYDLQHATHGAE